MGLLNALERLHRAGVTVVVTNGTEEQQGRTGLGRLVSGVGLSEVVGVRKPGPKIFELAISIGGGWAESS